MTFVNFPWAALATVIIAMFGLVGGVIVFAFRAGKLVSFVEKLENNHLPHIYKTLNRIARKMDIEIDEE